MLFLISLFSKTVLFFIPIVVLPIALAIDHYVMLRLSIIFCTYHLLLGAVKFATRDKLTSWSWVYEVPLLMVYLGCAWYLVPHFAEIAYGNALKYAGPALLLFESVQVVRIIMHISNALVTHMSENPDSETLIKSVILGSSLFAYVTSGVMVYFLFTHEAITVPLASYLSSILTLLVCMAIVVVMFVEGGILSDIAFISLFVLFVVRGAFLEAPVHTVTGFFDSSLSMNYFKSLLNDTFHLNFANVSVNFSQFLTFDFLISTLLAASTILSFPYIDYTPNDPDKYKFLKRKGDEEDDNRNAFQRNFFGAFLVMFFTHVILTATGNITSAGPGWRVVQSVVTIGFYLWRLYQVTQDEDVVGLKRD